MSFHTIEPTIEIPHISVANVPAVSILAAGEFPKVGSLGADILAACYARGDRHLVCCDGAFDKLQRAGYSLPDAVVGDMDSISQENLRLLGERVHRDPDQETNDLTKTVCFVRRKYAPSSLCILGLTGLREDHTLGNIALLPTYVRGGIDLLIAPTPYGCLFAFEGTALIHGQAGRQVSIFDFYRSAISTQGLRWELNNRVLSELWMGTLNRMEGDRFLISSSKPIVLSLQNEIK
ncbi:MAG: thiamine diphosphokinase [Porphyromonas sp.]|nr:thiamine diphosphokinase [Porphyromonas sp.]